MTEKTFAERQAIAATGLFEEYPVLYDRMDIQEFIDGAIEASNGFLEVMASKGMHPYEAQELAIQMYVIEPLKAELGDDIGYLLNGE